MFHWNKKTFWFLTFAPILLIDANLVQASGITSFSDTIFNSAVSANVNHEIEFIVAGSIPVSGKIIITPQSGAFNIPAALDFTDIDLLINGSQKILAASAGSGSGSALGISVTSGTSGNITVTLNDADSVGANSDIILKIGNHTTFQTSGEQKIQNPAANGSYRINAKTQNASSTDINSGDTMVVILDSVEATAAKSAPAPAPSPAPAPAAEAGGGGGGAIGAPVLPVTYTGLNGTATILPSVAGLLIHRNPDGSSLTLKFPLGFWSHPVTFFISRISRNTIETVAFLPAPLNFVNDHIYSITATDATGGKILKFIKPIEIQIRYTNVQIIGFDEASIKIFNLDKERNLWNTFPVSPVDLGENVVSVFFDQLPLIAVGARPSRIVFERKGDFNKDNRVDLVDFSILLFNWGVPKNPVTDLNNDAKVDLVDFSILLYWWTG